MTARPVAELPDDEHAAGFAHEPKLDGWRGVAIHRVSGRIDLQSRRQKYLTGYFPEIVAGLLEQVPAGTALDGSWWCAGTVAATSPRCISVSAAAVGPHPSRSWRSTC